VYTYRNDGAPISSIVGEWIRIHDSVSAIIDGERVHVRARVRFAGYPSATYIDNEIYVTNGTEPVISVYRLDGTLARQIRVEMPPEEISPRDRAQVLAALDQDVKRALNPSPGTVPTVDGVASARARRDAPRYAQRKAFWVSIYVDDQGFIWLRRPAASGGSLAADEPTFWVLNPNGEFLGVTRPPGFLRVMRGHLLSVQEDPETAELIPTVHRIHSANDEFRY
jgi:hypothetical protein